MKKSIIILAVITMLVSCTSIEKMAVNQFAKSLGQEEGGALNAFLKDDDPQLVAEALPSIMKLLESATEMSPENPDLKYSCGMMYVMYSTAFLQIPSTMEASSNFREQQQMLRRAKKLYKRGLDYIIQALDLKYPGFKDSMDSGNIDLALNMIPVEDAEWLYWAGAGWLGLYASDPMDFAVGTNAYKGVAMLLASLRLDEDVAGGGAHDLLVQIYGTLPSLIVTAQVKAPELGEYFRAYYLLAEVSEDPMDRAEFHYDSSVSISSGLRPGPYMAYAKTISVKEQNLVEFELMMNRIMELDPYKDETQTLLIVIYQQQAEWMLENVDDFFILSE